MLVQVILYMSSINYPVKHLEIFVKQIVDKAQPLNRGYFFCRKSQQRIRHKSKEVDIGQSGGSHI
jgi:hypothetical protein